MQREIVVTETPADEAARRITARLSARLESERWASLAISGGSTPDPMLNALAVADLPWHRIGILQVDERAAPVGHHDRNLTSQHRRLLARVDSPSHPLPVDIDPLDRAARVGQRILRAVAGDPPSIDVVHLGLGDDGHTASLVPGDPVLDVDDRDVAATVDPYQGRRRLTLTAPALSRAGLVVWLVVGDGKREALERLLDDDPDIPATLVRADHQVVVTDLDVA